MRVYLSSDTVIPNTTHILVDLKIPILWSYKSLLDLGGCARSREYLFTIFKKRHNQIREKILTVGEASKEVLPFPVSKWGPTPLLTLSNDNLEIKDHRFYWDTEKFFIKLQKYLKAYPRVKSITLHLPFRFYMRKNFNWPIEAFVARLESIDLGDREDKVFAVLLDSRAEKLYYQLGIPLIPCLNSRKDPYVSGWANRIDDPAAYKELLKDCENVAIKLGGDSGIVALDLDYNLNGEHEKISQIVPFSPCGKFGIKGGTFFYAYNGEESFTIESPSGKTIMDVLSDEKKCLIPSSIHPQSETPYRWIGQPLHKYLAEGNKLPKLPPNFKGKLKTILSPEYYEYLDKKQIYSTAQ